jgi:hypothetical protein
MTNVTAEMAKKPTAKTTQADRAPTLTGEYTAQHALDACYRQIGISAVAAAARYQGVAKNPAYAPTPIKWQDYTDETAA